MVMIRDFLKCHQTRVKCLVKSRRRGGFLQGTLRAMAGTMSSDGVGRDGGKGDSEEGIWGKQLMLGLVGSGL